MSWSSSPSPTGSSVSSLDSIRISRSASSRELVTETLSPSAIERAPARRPAIPIIRIPWIYGNSSHTHHQAQIRAEPIVRPEDYCAERVTSYCSMAPFDTREKVAAETARLRLDE